MSVLDLVNWKEDLKNIWTHSLWIITRRENGNGHEHDYYGSFVPQIPFQLISRYTRPGEIVLDPMIGSGTTAIEALNLGRHCLGVELNPELVRSVQAKIDARAVELENQAWAFVLPGNSCDPAIVGRVRGYQGGQTIGLVLLHPPYHDIIKFTGKPDDLSSHRKLPDFLDAFEQVARNSFELLAPGRFAGLVIGDIYRNKELIPLHAYCMERMVKVGFKLKAVVVKNMSGNQVGKGSGSQLWRRRALSGDFYTFDHEYVVVCYKPEEKE